MKRVKLAVIILLCLCVGLFVFFLLGLFKRQASLISLCLMGVLCCIIVLSKIIDNDFKAEEQERGGDLNG